MVAPEERRSLAGILPIHQSQEHYSTLLHPLPAQQTQTKPGLQGRLGCRGIAGWPHGIGPLLLGL